MDIKPLFLLLVLNVASVCDAATSGIVSMNIGGETRLYSLKELSPNERVQFQYPDQTGTTRCCISRRGKSFEISEGKSVAMDALGDKPVFQYRLIVQPQLIGKSPFLGLAVIGPVAKIEKATAQSIKVRLTDKVLIVRSCTSQEGLHVIGETRGKIISDLYYGFDYQVEKPTCISK